MVTWHNFSVNVVLWIGCSMFLTSYSLLHEENFFFFSCYLFYQGHKKLVQICRGMFSRFCACFSSLLVKTELVLRNWDLLS